MTLPGQIMTPLVAMPDDPSECWNWIGKVNPKTGYGHKQLGGKTLLAHRWMYTIFNGHLPEDLVIDHLCGNRKCVNPSHLEAVHQTTNCRRGKGAKLNRDQVIDIKRQLETAKWGDRKKIAKDFGVSEMLISDIKYGRAWKDVSP